MGLFVDVHVLQTVPPANLNRDDTGSPKSATYGGVRRARVSSQSWKRAVRLSMRAGGVPDERLAVRARLTPRLVEALRGRDRSRDAKEAEAVAGVAVRTLGGEEGKKDAPLFLDHGAWKTLVSRVDAGYSELASKNKAARDRAAADVGLKELFARCRALDLALFGRMVAVSADLNVEAATQVAHALSTHAVDTEFDYFTAVDDLQEAEDTGAGMIGTIEFNSATLYRYASLDLNQLTENLGGEDVLGGVAAFLWHFVRSLPSGHRTSFAHATVPDAVVFMARDDQPVNLVGAFEEPVAAARAGGHAVASADRLVDYAEEVFDSYGIRPVEVKTTGRVSCRPALSRLAEPESLDQAIEGIVSALDGSSALVGS